MSVTNSLELDYMERYVNDGSPSGFTIPGQMSADTDPFGESPSFSPYRIHHKSGLSLEVHRSPRHLQLPIDVDFLVHPDMVEQWLAKGCEVVPADDVKVIPTSSGRTVRVCNETRSYYLKFDYNKTLGRVNRAITRIKALASIEMNEEVYFAAESFADRSVSYLPEYTAVLARPLGNEDVEWAGLVLRDGDPIIFGETPPTRLVPLFAFWSEDRRSSQVDYVFETVFRSDTERYASVLSHSAMTMIDLYFHLLLTRGLQMEFNAQNVLIGVDDQNNFCCVVLRDFSSTEKDIPIRKILKLPIEFSSAPYKCLYDLDNNYLIRHSFAFDFKLTDYVVIPALLAAEAKVSGAYGVGLDLARRKTRDWITLLPHEVFPSNVWYRHPQQDLTKERPYEEVPSPKLR